MLRRRARTAVAPNKARSRPAEALERTARENRPFRVDSHAVVCSVHVLLIADWGYISRRDRLGATFRLFFFLGRHSHVPLDLGEKASRLSAGFFPRPSGQFAQFVDRGRADLTASLNVAA